MTTQKLEDMGFVMFDHIYNKQNVSVWQSILRSNLWYVSIHSSLPICREWTLAEIIELDKMFNTRFV